MTPFQPSPPWRQQLPFRVAYPVQPAPFKLDPKFKPMGTVSTW